MPARGVNYLVFYTNESQVWGAASRDIALASPPPAGVPIEDKRICFITYQPDDEILSVHPLPLEEVRAAEIIYPKKKGKSEEDNET